jgi:hypothetical protein
LLAGTEADWTIKKAGVWWFSNRVRHDETKPYCAPYTIRETDNVSLKDLRI